MSSLSRKCCCVGDSECQDVWVWKSEFCNQGNTKLYAPQAMWDSFIPTCATPWDIVWDYTTTPPSYTLTKNGAAVDTKVFSFNGAFIDVFNPNPPDPIGLLGCGELRFAGYLCDRQGTERCDPDLPKGEGCLCMREQIASCPSPPLGNNQFCEDCDELSDFVSDADDQLYIIGFGTRPAGFDDMGYPTTTSCRGKSIWLGRGWYNNSSWDINQTASPSPSFPRYICIADDCCDSQCDFEEISCPDWMSQTANYPIIEFVIGNLPESWSSSSPSNSNPTITCDWELEYNEFSYVWNPADSRFEDMRLSVTATLRDYSGPSDGACQTRPEPSVPASQDYLLCDPPPLDNNLGLCPPNAQTTGVIGSFSSCGSNPPSGVWPGSDYCCIDFGGIEICQRNISLAVNLNFSAIGLPWPPQFGQTVLVPCQINVSSGNSGLPVRPNCNNNSFPPTPCNNWDSGTDDNLYGFLKITMPEGPPECDP